MITRSSIYQREFTAPYQRLEIPQASLNDATIAVLAGVSKEIGVDLVMTF